MCERGTCFGAYLRADGDAFGSGGFSGIFENVVERGRGGGFRERVRECLAGDVSYLGQRSGGGVFDASKAYGDPSTLHVDIVVYGLSN